MAVEKKSTQSFDRVEEVGWEVQLWWGDGIRSLCIFGGVASGGQGG